MNEFINVTGNLEIKKYDSKWNLIDTHYVKNLVVSIGKNYIINRMVNNSNLVMSHMAVGNQNTAPIANETQLGSEIGRVTLDSSLPSGNSILYTATFPAGTGTGSLTEAGIFNPANVMLCRSQFNEIPKGVSENIIITWTTVIQ